ncbi:MAG: trigger factor, partial [Spirochaetaceae bacterium]|nr:trigger factor [Spirochaetaceae bacterium]
MEVTKEITKLENSAVKLTVTIPQKDVAAEYNESVAKYAKNVQIPGFRKGKVPASVLERKYGEMLKADAAGELIEKALGEIFESIDEKPLPYAQPTMEEAPVLDITKDLTFT